MANFRHIKDNGDGLVEILDLWGKDDNPPYALCVANFTNLTRAEDLLSAPKAEYDRHWRCAVYLRPGHRLVFSAKTDTFDELNGQIAKFSKEADGRFGFTIPPLEPVAVVVLPNPYGDLYLVRRHNGRTGVTTDRFASVRQSASVFPLEVARQIAERFNFTERLGHKNYKPEKLT